MNNKSTGGSSNESSLLLKYPINIFSPHSNTENLLMPVGVQETSASITESNTSSELSSFVEPRRSSLCQLEQPLHFGGGPPKPCLTEPSVSLESEISIPTQSTATVSYSHPDIENSSSTVQTTISSCIPHGSQPFQTASVSNYNCYADSYHGHNSKVTNPIDYSSDSMSRPNILISRAISSNSVPSFDYALSSYQSNQVQEHSISSYFEPVRPFWFFSDVVESKEIWYGFSKSDSERLENAYQQGIDSVVSTDGGRCDVNLHTRKKRFVYFGTKELDVRRCTWFHQQGSSMRFKPYNESIADSLEDYYQNWISSGSHDSRFVIPGIIGSFLFEKPEVKLHYNVDASTWTAPNEPKGSPKIVKRGLPDGFQIMPDESSKIDHLLFIVQGIGSFCDLRFRTVFECVDGFRDIANKLISSHFTKEVQQEKIGRVEILPVAWHSKLRTNDIGLDCTMKTITLPSIPKLRHFTNDTLIDILLYSSPLYCQSILDTVAQEMNNLYKVFVSRNPEFSGRVFVAGHSLGSLILFDILSNQNSEDNEEKEQVLNEEKNAKKSKNVELNFADIEQFLKSLNLEEYIDIFNKEKIDLLTLPYVSEEDLKSIGIPTGPRKKLINGIFFNDEEKSIVDRPSESMKEEQHVIKEVNVREESNNDESMTFPSKKSNFGTTTISYPRLFFNPAAFFAMGSPISMFLAIRGFDTISEKYNFPTCPAFFHIFHPYDPVAFRIEPMIDHTYLNKPALIPHHKGRKRMHLEIKENVAKFANEFRQKFMDTLNKTWHSFNEFTKFHPFPSAIMESEVNSMVPQEISEIASNEDNSSFDTPIGNLNGGRRIDYVLQEKPLEALNDYVWALTSHATYWDSEDTVLMILREIYAIQGINMSPLSENDNYMAECVTKEICIKDFEPYTEILENSHLPNYDCQSIYASNNYALLHSNPMMTTSENLSPMPSFTGSSTSAPGSQHIGPPPLSGFVKRSAFSK